MKSESSSSLVQRLHFKRETGEREGRTNVTVRDLMAQRKCWITCYYKPNACIHWITNTCFIFRNVMVHKHWVMDKNLVPCVLERPLSCSLYDLLRDNTKQGRYVVELDEFFVFNSDGIPCRGSTVLWLRILDKERSVKFKYGPLYF